MPPSLNWFLEGQMPEGQNKEKQSTSKNIRLWPVKSVRKKFITQYIMLRQLANYGKQVRILPNDI